MRLPYEKRRSLPMQVARVVGRATATIKHYSLERQKLLIVKPLMADGVRIDGEPIITIDLIGAGVGDEVILSSDGASVRQALNIEHNPVRWSIVGIVDPSATSGASNPALLGDA